MAGAFAALFRLFLTPVGLPILAALDSTLIFFFPLGVDLVLVLMTARNPSLAWLYPLVAAGGSVAGAAGTYWIGRKIGEHGLARFVSPQRLQRVRKRLGSSAAISIGLLALVPPPFPFTAFTLAAGACRTGWKPFLAAFAVARLLRFGVAAGLALVYGTQIVRWMESDTFELVVGSFIVLALAGTAYSAWRIVRSTRTPRHAAAA